MAPLYTELRCRSGSKPESAAAIRRELLGCLLAADFKGWNVVVVGEPASKVLRIRRAIDNDPHAGH